MKNQIFALMVTTAICVVSPTFAMDVDENKKEQLCITLKKLAHRRDKEIKYQSKLIRKENANNQMHNPRGFFENIKAYFSGPSDVQKSEAMLDDKVLQIHHKMIEIKNILGHQVNQTIILTPLGDLISEAKNRNSKAQDELIKRQYQTIGSPLTPDVIDFHAWSNLNNRCYENDAYAWFALSHNVRIPHLFEKIKEKADKNIPTAQHRLGWIYASDQGVGGESDENKKRAVEWFMKAARQGYAGSQYWLGWMYAKGLGTDKNDVEAVKWYRRAARKGDADAQYKLGRMYAKGLGIDKNDVEASKCFKKAAEQGHPEAQYYLGARYANGQMVGGKSAENDKLAFEWLTEAAEQEYVIAQYKLGEMYAKGQGRDKNDTEAIRWYKKAAKQGYAKAQYELGMKYAKEAQGVGRPSAQYDKLAIEWLTYAAEQGHVNAQFKLGLMYVLAYKNDAEAVKWHKKAAEQGHADAQYWLGKKYAAGLGVEKNLAEAFHWWLKSKKPEVSESIFSLLKPLQFATPKNENRSFKDRLHEILQEDQLHKILLEEGFDQLSPENQLNRVEQGLTPNNPKGATMGLASLVYTHQARMEANNIDGFNAALSDPHLYEAYKRIEAIEGECSELITSLKTNATPGFMLTAFSPSKELEESIPYQNSSPFLSIDTIGTKNYFYNETYLSIGEQNVVLAGKLVKYLETIDKKFTEADNILKSIVNWYQEKLSALSEELSNIRFAAKKDSSENAKFKQQCKEIRQGKERVQKEINQIEYEIFSLNDVRNKIKIIVSDGANKRNEEFCKDNIFLDVQGHLKRLQEEAESKRNNNNKGGSSFDSQKAAAARQEGRMYCGRM